MATRSANLDFFVGREDLRRVLDFCFAETDVRVFESYSLLDAELREFRSTDQVAAAFPLGTDERGDGYAITLKLWSPSVMRTLDIRRINLNPEACPGRTYRYCIEGGGLIDLSLGGVSGEVVTRSNVGHQSETRAVTWNVAEGVEWGALGKLSARILYHIRQRLAAAKVRSCPILPEAYGLAKQGYRLKTTVKASWDYDFETRRDAT